MNTKIGDWAFVIYLSPGFEIGAHGGPCVRSVGVWRISDDQSESSVKVLPGVLSQALGGWFESLAGWLNPIDPWRCAMCKEA